MAGAYRQAECAMSPSGICDNQVGRKGIKAAGYALYRSIKLFKSMHMYVFLISSAKLIFTK